MRVSVDDVKRVRAAFGGTVNDVVLAGRRAARWRGCSTLTGRAAPRAVLKVFCPVSVRDDDQRMQLGNRISTMLVPLAVGEPDPLVRLDRGAAHHRGPQGTPAGGRRRRARSDLSEYAAPTLLGLAARVAHAQRVRQPHVTNMPGPQVPLYCLGARMLEVYPVVPLSRNLTLNVAILSYCGQLHFGLIGDGAVGPRPRTVSPAGSRTRSRSSGAARPRCEV